MGRSLDLERIGEQWIQYSSEIQLEKSKQPMFVAFIDAKAFDSVHHQLLWMKLSALGYSTKMLKIVQNMYSNASSVVMMEGCISTSSHAK